MSIIFNALCMSSATILDKDFKIEVEKWREESLSFK